MDLFKKIVNLTGLEVSEYISKVRCQPGRPPGGQLQVPGWRPRKLRTCHGHGGGAVLPAAA